MTPDRLSACLSTIRWENVTLTRSVNVPLLSIEQWAAGSWAIPRAVGSWLGALTFLHETAEESKPVIVGQGFLEARLTRFEHIPFYAHQLLRRLGSKPVALLSLFGTDDEGAVFFLVSRGLASREAGDLTARESMPRPK